MRSLRRYITLLTALALTSLTIPAVAADFGDLKDVKQVRTMVASKFDWHPMHASVSHDWALCTAYQPRIENSNVSVLLHRTESVWKIVQYDGGAYVEESLKDLGIPQADIPLLLKAYQ
jgi:hypothetical protein